MSASWLRSFADRRDTLDSQAMRAVVTGSNLRRLLTIIVHDAAQPATMRMEQGTGPRLVACK